MSEKLFKKALVPVNASDLSERVINQTAQCVLKGLAEEITLISVWEPGDVDYTKLHAAEKEEILKSQALKVLGRYCQQLREQGVETKTILKGGIPADVILEQVKKDNYDLIIMGSRKLNKLQELVFGSVSDRVTRLSSVPVLIVK